jgi:hypothetical protein
LKESEERFRIAVKNSKFVLAQFDLDLRYTWIFNPHPDFDAPLLIEKRSEERLRRFYDSGMFGVFYYNLNGSVTDANDKFLEIIGYTRDDLQAGLIEWGKLTPSEYSPLDEYAIA